MPISLVSSECFPRRSLFADSGPFQAKGELRYGRAQTRHSPGYSLETTLLPVSRRLHIDQLNAEMGALSWKRQVAADNRISPVGTGGTLAEASLRQREVCNARFAVLLMGS